MDANQDQQATDLSPYKVHSRREIVALLNALSAHKQLINMLANHGDTAILTSILAVDEGADEVIIDCAQRERLNEHIMASDNLSFETALEQIRIVFFASRVEACVYGGAPALKIALPQTLIRLQRREYYRVPTPMTNPVSCQITIPQDAGPGARPFSMTLQNVSGGGLALIDEHHVLDPTIGKVYSNCHIDLPGGVLVVASLQLRNVQEVTLANGRQVRRLGCLFLDLPQGMLAAVQRYISKLEREQNARAGGRLG
jgi:c-di-GMP-binding flagellar brake protein YcgR